MKFSREILYKAVLARDNRFDGKFFIGVKTTGIYCRPICPARPKIENITFYKTSFEAEKAGFRPCLRCRPEAAPMSAAWIGTSATVKRALALLDNYQFTKFNEDKFADSLGISSRHLRRLFENEIGKTPKQILNDKRLNFARKLIVETNIPITNIALDSEFNSIRTFNSAFKNRFKAAPSEVRNSKKNSESVISVRLSYRPPYDWESILLFFKNHLIEGVEKVTDTYYERVFEIDNEIGAFRVENDKDNSQLIIKISTQNCKAIYFIVQKIKKMFDIDCDPMTIDEAFAQSKFIHKIFQKHKGIRVARGWDNFEITISTILGQVVSLKQARKLVSLLVKTEGRVVKNPLTNEDAFLFPSTEKLMNASLSEIPTTVARKKSINTFSKMLYTNEIGFDENIESFKEKLLSIPGIGQWTFDYLSLRGLSDTDAFPKGDLILKRVLQEYAKIAYDKFKPWRAYLAVLLWQEFATSLSKTRIKKAE